MKITCGQFVTVEFPNEVLVFQVPQGYNKWVAPKEFNDAMLYAQALSKDSCEQADMVALIAERKGYTHTGRINLAAH